MLENFRVARYQIILSVGKPGLEIRTHPGARLFEGLRICLRKLVCTSGEAECFRCGLHKSCAYPALFPVVSARGLLLSGTLPPSFVVEPPRDLRTRYRMGDPLVIGIVVVGRAIEFFPHLVASLRELGKASIPQSLGKYRVAGVLAVHPFTGRHQLLYSSESGFLRGIDMSARASEAFHCVGDLDPERLALEFITLTCLEHGHRLVRQAEFHILMRNLLKRIAALNHFYHDTPLDVDAATTVEKSRFVYRETDQTRWIQPTRYIASRDVPQVPAAGMVGRVVYAGKLAPFLPFIKLGEVIHVGRGAEYGLGHYVILR